MPPRVLASGPKPCGGNYSVFTNFHALVPLKVDDHRPTSPYKEMIDTRSRGRRLQ